MFNDEKSLVNHFKSSLKSISSPWGNLQIGSEFFYQRGKTDLVAVTDKGKVIAFEAKLSKWRSALQQAYRNRCFADLSYVVLPARSAKLALKHLDEFAERGVGICCVSENNMEVLYDVTPVQPLQPWLHDQARIFVSNGGD